VDKFECGEYLEECMLLLRQIGYLLQARYGEERAGKLFDAVFAEAHALCLRGKQLRDYLRNCLVQFTKREMK